MNALTNLAERMSFWRNGSVPPTNYKLGDSIKDMIRRWEAKIEYTPDASILTQYPLIPVFMYGTTMEKYPEADLVSQFNGMPTLVAFTYGSFSCMKKKLGSLSFPIAMEPKPAVFSFSPPQTVKGQLFFLPPEAFYTLDKRFRNGVQFTRKLVSICAFNRSDKKLDPVEYEFEAFMYVGNPEYWDDQFDMGYWFEPVKIMEPNKFYKVPYYFFLWDTGDPIQEEEPIIIKKWRSRAVTTPVPRDENWNSTIKATGDTVEIISEEYVPESQPNYYAPAVVMPRKEKSESK